MRKGSKQREIVLRILKDSYNHPTAEEVFRQARDIDNNISLGTVYRNLDILCKEHIIEKIATNTGVDRYDFKKSIHSHAVCDECGNVIDFESYVNMGQVQQELKDNFTITLDEIRICGICKTCQNKLIGDRK